MHESRWSKTIITANGSPRIKMDGHSIQSKKIDGKNERSSLFKRPSSFILWNVQFFLPQVRPLWYPSVHEPPTFDGSDHAVQPKWPSYPVHDCFLWHMGRHTQMNPWNFEFLSPSTDPVETFSEPQSKHMKSIWHMIWPSTLDLSIFLNSCVEFLRMLPLKLPHFYPKSKISSFCTKISPRN